jgi:hypothetical protein
MKESSDYVSTAIFAAMILLERPGAFTPTPVKRQKTVSNKDAYRLATEAQSKGDIPKAFRYFAEVLPLGDSEELVPLAQAELKKIEAPIRQRLKEISEAEEQDLAQARELAAAKDYRAALVLYDRVVQAYAALQKEYAGVPFVDETKIHLAELKKKMQPLVTSAAYSAGRTGASLPPKSVLADTTKSASTTPARTAAAASAPDADVKKWTDRLRQRVTELTQSGDKPRFQHHTFGQRMSISKIDSEGKMAATLDRGGQMDLRWEQLKSPEWLSLAQNLSQSQQTQADHALAAFFELQFGNKERAEELLQKAGPEGAALRQPSK